MMSFEFYKETFEKATAGQQPAQVKTGARSTSDQDKSPIRLVKKAFSSGQKIWTKHLSMLISEIVEFQNFKKAVKTDIEWDGQGLSAAKSDN